jgi:hypothetical protein
MRLLALPLTLPLKVLRGALSLVLGSDEPAPAPVAERPAPPIERPEPAHVSEEPELVAESADRGSEEGAGAELHVDEPWSGYARMTAADIRSRLQAEGLEAATHEINARPSG